MRTHSILVILLLSVPSQALAWGAVSHDVLTGQTRYCTGHTSETNASSCSMNACQGRCNVISTFRDTCAAVVVDGPSGLAHVATGPEGREARFAAIELCGQSGGLDCAVTLSVCDGTDLRG